MVTIEDTYDWDKMTGLLAAQAPWWEPGTQSGYHAMTQGYLIGEVVRRVTGISRSAHSCAAKSPNRSVRISTSASTRRHFGRVGDLIPPPTGAAPLAACRTGFDCGTFVPSPPVNALDSRTDGWRRAEIPAANGHGNARSVAKIQTLLANGGTRSANGFCRSQGASASSKSKPTAGTSCSGRRCVSAWGTD